MTQAVFGPIGVLGKLPSQGDFIRLGAFDAAFASFDAFLTEGIEWAESHAQATWAEFFPRAPMQAFVYRSKAQSGSALLAGALVPSQDCAGRRFPLSVAAPFIPGPLVLAASELLPLVLETCWQATSQLLAEARSASPAEIGARLPALVDPSALELEEARASYSEWARTLPVDELWALLFGNELPVDPALVLEFVYQAVLPSRGHERSTTPLSLRLPLGAAGGAAVCFWLDFVRRVARWRATVPTFFWSHDGESGFLFLCLGEPPKSTLAELWQPSGGRDEVCDISHLLSTGDGSAFIRSGGATGTVWGSAVHVSDLLQVAATLET